MKNSSIVGACLAGALLAAAAGAAAVECKFLPNAPDQHTVVRGDTLWDISGKFLEHPWCWPQVWGMNKEEIHNPHWIYPGQVIYFDRAHNRLSLTPPGAGGEGGGSGGAGEPPLMKLSPQLRTEGLGKEAVRSIPSNVIEPFLSHQTIVDPAAMAAAPHVVATPEGRYFVGQGDRLYVRGELKGGTAFQVFRPAQPLVDPVTHQLLAHEAFYLGTVNLQRPAHARDEAHVFTVASSKEEIGAGDILLPAPPTPLMNYVPHPPDMRIDARVVSVPGGVSYAGQNSIVAINRGEVDGIDIGTVLELYHFGKTIADPAHKGVLGFGGEKIKLPDEQYGNLFVFRVFKNVSYALVMRVTEPVEVGDVAKSPE
ncbi:MAG: LysM peptidoglycan-binding domain-containing protein [Telluria sp.]